MSERGVLRTFEVGESLRGLEEDAQAQREQEHAVEEGAEDLCAFPAEGEALRGFFSFRDLLFCSAVVGKFG